jgi:hypothetical protein
MAETDAHETQVRLTPEKAFEAFKFYEEAAEKTKSHAWSQTTWILTLNAGILAFSLDLYAEHREVPGFLVIEWISFVAGAGLSLFLIYVISELGRHISTYWTQSNRLAGNYPILVPFVGEDEAAAARSPLYHAPFPKFCRRLQIPAIAFVIAHLTWACVATWFVRV